MPSVFTKDPDATLDYKFDWSNWLDSDNNEVIDSFTIDADSGITVDSSSATDSNTSVTVWLSGGTASVTYAVRCEVTTDSAPARTDERTIHVRVAER